MGDPFGASALQQANATHEPLAPESPIECMFAGELANSPSKLTLWVIERVRGFLEHWRAPCAAQPVT
jgi:hypothetical protein